MNEGETPALLIMNNNFAKIFQSEAFGQILVKKDDNDQDDPEIRFFFNPDQLGICSLAVAFKNVENQDKAQKEVFEGLTLEKVEGVVENAVSEMNEVTRQELSFTGQDL